MRRNMRRTTVMVVAICALVGIFVIALGFAGFIVIFTALKYSGLI